MTFDQWIDAVNAQVRAKLGSGVRTEELSWDGAVWKSARGTAVAALSTDGVTATVFFDGGDKLTIGGELPSPDTVGSAIAERLAI